MKPYYSHAGIEIYHGDCREIMPDLSTDLVLSDPPYGIDLENHHQGQIGEARRVQIAGDQDTSLAFWLSAYCEQRSWPLICFGSPKIPITWRPKQTLIWDKGPAVGGGGDPERYWKFTYELIHIQGTEKLNGQRDSSVLRYYVTPDDSRLHPAQKPVRLLRYLLIKTTRDEHTVIDPFMGSGSTLEAAKNLCRSAIGIEIEEKYCEIAAKRLSQEVFAFE